jgi:hypothetical protein
MNVNLSDELDSFKWNLTTTGNFSVKSMYTNYINGHTVFLKGIGRQRRASLLLICGIDKEGHHYAVWGFHRTTPDGHW